MRLEKSFLKICLLFAVFLEALLALAIFGYFKYWPVAIAAALFLAASLFIVGKSLFSINWKDHNRTQAICFIIIIFFSVFIGIFHHDLPTERDELSFIYSADRLTATGSLEWTDYLTRPMHGVRNLGDDTFTSQFLPVYSSYLSVYKILGGLEALLWANVLLMLLTLGVIYYLVKSLATEKASLLALIFLLSAYVFFWFPKRTNVENISILLMWLGIWLAVKSIRSGKPVWLVSGLLPFSLLLLTRPEGVIYFAGYLLVAVILWATKLRKQLFHNRVTNITLILLCLANLALFYLYIKFYEARYIFNQFTDVIEGFSFIYQRLGIMIVAAAAVVAVVAVVIKIRRKLNIQRLLFWLITSAVVLYETLFYIKVGQGHLTWTVYRSQYVLENFSFYLYFIYLFIVLVGLRKRLFTFFEFLIAVILGPSFLFIIEPNIALDQPWFMRRFYPNLIPFLIILSAVVLIRLRLTKRQLKYIVISAVVIGIVTTRSIFFFIEHKGLKTQVEEFNKIFPRDALIVMNPGWSWQKIAIIQHYFYGYNALPNIDLYLPEQFERDLPQLIKQYPNWQTDNADLAAIMNWEKGKSEAYFVDLVRKYPAVYAVTLEKNSNFMAGFRDQNLELVDSFTFKYRELKKESNLTQYIQQTKIIDLSKIRKMQNILPPNTIEKQTLDLNIFKVKNSQEFIPTKYVLTVAEIQPDSYVNFVLTEADINSYRKELQNRISSDLTAND